MWLEKDALRAVDIVGRRLQWHLDVTEQMICTQLAFYCATRGIALRAGRYGIDQASESFVAPMKTGGRKKIDKTTPDGKRKQVYRAGNDSHDGHPPFS